MKEALADRLAAIDWPSFETAYGTAEGVPGQLTALLSGNEEAALEAASALWAGLCHQHAYVSSAALPSLPFILDALEGASERLTVEILDILLGFAVCSSEGAAWMLDLRRQLNCHVPVFKRLVASPNQDIQHFAREIVADLER